VRLSQSVACAVLSPPMLFVFVQEVKVKPGVCGPFLSHVLHILSQSSKF